MERWWYRFAAICKVARDADAGNREKIGSGRGPGTLGGPNKTWVEEERRQLIHGDLEALSHEARMEVI